MQCKSRACPNRLQVSLQSIRAMYYLIKLRIQFELEVDRSEFDNLIEEGGGPADIPFLSLLVIGHLR